MTFVLHLEKPDDFEGQVINAFEWKVRGNLVILLIRIINFSGFSKEKQYNIKQRKGRESTCLIALSVKG